jgi:hypothetical protein
MQRLFKKVKTNDYFIYGFIRENTNFLIDKWNGYSIENMDKVAKYSNNHILSYDDVEYCAYITLLSLFFSASNNNYIIYEDNFQKDKHQDIIETRFKLNITYETIENEFQKLSLYNGSYERKDNLYFKKILELKNFFTYNIIAHNGNSSQGVTFMVTNKEVAEQTLVELINNETDINIILDYVCYIVVFEVGHDMGDINGFNIYSKNNIEDYIVSIEDVFLSRINNFNDKLKNISNELDFVKALEVFIGNDNNHTLVWQ